jgi:hypothetical protein
MRSTTDWFSREASTTVVATVCIPALTVAWSGRPAASPVPVTAILRLPADDSRPETCAAAMPKSPRLKIASSAAGPIALEVVTQILLDVLVAGGASTRR